MSTLFFNFFHYKILDEAEYEYHKKKMNYPKEIDTIVKEELKKLIKLYIKKDGAYQKLCKHSIFNGPSRSTCMS